MSMWCLPSCVEIRRSYVTHKIRLNTPRKPWTHHANIQHKVDIEPRRFSISMRPNRPSEKHIANPQPYRHFRTSAQKVPPLTLPQKSATPQRPWLAWAAALRQPFGHFCVPATQPKSATSIKPCLVARNTGDHEAHGLRDFVAALRQFWERRWNFK